MPASCDISWASKTVELALWRRSSRRKALTEERRKIMTSCKKLYAASREVEEIDVECAEWAAKAPNQEEHFAI